MRDDVLKKLNELYSNEHVKNYINKALALQEGAENYLNYFGINYDDKDILNLKIYFTYFKKLSKIEVEQLLPNCEDFFKEYNNLIFDNIHALQNTGCTFAIKIDTNFKVTYYYHFRLPGKTINMPKKITLTSSEIESNNNTRCMEYSGDNVFSKDYYLLFDKLNIVNLLNRFNVDFFKKNDFLPNVIEYTETSNWNKIIIGVDDPVIQNKYIQTLKDEYMLEIINFLCDKKSLMTASCSIYENSNVKAVYFCEKKENVFLRNNNTIFVHKEKLFDV